MNSMKKFEMVRTAAAIFIALTIGMLLILLVSKQPVEALTNFIIGPLTKTRYIGNVIEAAIPLIFSGLAVSVLFQTKLFNMGAEGIFYISGLTAAILGIVLELPPIIHPIVAILGGALVGALVMGIVGFFKAKWNVSELVLSLMFNSILLGLGLFILNYFFRETNTVRLKSVEIHSTALLSKIVPTTRIHSGILIALLAVVLVHIFIYRTKWGYQIRMVGSNDKFADYSGIKVGKIVILASLVAGGLAGMGGAVEVLGMHTNFNWAALPGYGFDGALIAMLAKNKPINVIFSALFLAYIRTGAEIMARVTDVPAEMIGIMQGLIILLISGQKFLQFYKQRLILKEAEVK